MTNNNLTMIDLFAGAGGLSEGLSEAGFHSLFASEIMPVYAQTYRKNHPSAKVLTADIRNLDATEIRKELGIEREDLDLLAGGPPCQGFSINAPVRSVLDQRNHLFKEYLRFVDAFAPRAILIENVPGLVSFEHGATLLLTSSGDNVELLKTIESDKVLYKKPVTLYQGLHIQFSHSLFSEIFLLLLIFLYLFLKGVGLHIAVGVVILGIEIYLTLNILLSILRGAANLYFSFYDPQNKKQM